jgi:hypothetical protein
MKSFLLIVVFLTLALPSLADQRYDVETTIWKDTVWTGDILINSVVTVAPGVTLEVRPGATIRFTRFDSNRDQIGEHELFIQGRFVARGTAEQPILFTSAEERPVSGDWGAINMMASMAENILEHCRIEYAYRGFHAHFGRARIDHSSISHNRRGAQFQESDVQISQSLFKDNLNGLQFRDSQVNIVDSVVTGSYWGIRSVHSQVVMTDTLVEQNLINGVNFRESDIDLNRVTIRQNRRGLYLQRTSGSIHRSNLLNNSEHGLFVEDSDLNMTQTNILHNGRAGIRILNSELSLHDSLINRNDLYAVVNDGSTDLQFTGNWWGTSDPKRLEVLVRDGNDRPGLGKIFITKPLTARPAWAN